MPRTRREKAAAAAGSIGEMLHKKAATTSSGGVPMVHPGEEAADSSGEMLHKRAATTSSGGVPMVHPGEAAADSSGGVPMVYPGEAAADSSGGVPMVYPGEAAAASSGEMLHKKAGTASSGGVPMVQPGWEATDSSGEMLDKKAAASLVGGVPMVHSGEEAGSSGGMMHKKAAASLVGGLPMVHSGEGAGSSGGMMREVAAASLVGGVPMVHSGEEAGSSGGMMREVAAAASSGGVLTVYPIEEAVSTGSSGAMPQKKATASSSGSAALVAINVTAQVSEEFTPEHRAKKACTASTLEILQKHCTEDDADMSLSGGMLQKQSSKVEADTSLTGELVHEHPVKEAETAKNFQKSDGNEVVHVKLENEELQEAELLIQKLNHLGIGEHVSSDEFLGYFNGLPCRPRSINPTLELTDEELYKQMVCHALYRFKYYKHKLKEGKEDTFGLKDISEDDCDQELLEKHGFFRKLEKNWTIDWFFHPDYCMHASLNDYQRLVLRNYAGTEYIKWSEYHMFLNSPDTEEEYVKYSQELFKRLDWMEVYLNAYRRPSYKWDCISSRGAYQAMKIAATTFNKITASLAYLGYYECIQSMAYDRRWFKELDDAYFEIWQRVTQGMSFKAALKEVYELNIFPLRQLRMKAALEHEYTMEDMEGEFHTCTAAIPPGVKEDKAKELIAEAVIKLVDKPKSYEQYIRKKMEIARIVGILPPLEATV